MGEFLTTPNTVPTRYRWNLKDLFEAEVSWEEAFREVIPCLESLTMFRGTIKGSPQILADCLELRDTIRKKLQKLNLYAGLCNDQDTTIAKFQEMRDRVQTQLTRYYEKAAFIEPEILTLSESEIQQWVATQPELKDYQHQLEDLMRFRPYTLSPPEEKLLAMTGDIAHASMSIFSVFNNADIRFPSIQGEDGTRIEITKANYGRLAESQNRKIRKASFKGFYQSYKNWTNTLAATLSAAVKRNIFYARARGYSNSLSASLYVNKIPPKVYTNVVDTINNNLYPLHRYTKLRQKQLQIKKLQPWDLAVPLVNEITFNLPYEQAQEIIIKGLLPLGREYNSVLRKSFSSRWIDVFENKGKRGGAYSWSTHGCNPYILLNYNQSLSSVLTLAHELGHALHSYYTNKTQPYAYSQYSIFVAEVASNVNELLLLEYLSKQEQKKVKKLFFLNHYIEKLRGTVYIQTLFAEFEKQIHEIVEAGGALSAEVLNNQMHDLYSRYFGPAFAMDPLYAVNWCRINHFYNNFYVYQYVTGLAAAVNITEKILSENKSFVNDYIRFLSAGSSDYPVNLLNDLGVNLKTPNSIQASIAKMDSLLDEFEALTLTTL